MSIVKAINELSGKEATTIEKAIRNLELGGSAPKELVGKDIEVPVFTGTLTRAAGDPAEVTTLDQTKLNGPSILYYVVNGTKYTFEQTPGPQDSEQPWIGHMWYGAFDEENNPVFNDCPVSICYSINGREGTSDYVVYCAEGTYSVEIGYSYKGFDLPGIKSACVNAGFFPIIIEGVVNNGGLGDLTCSCTYEELSCLLSNNAMSSNFFQPILITVKKNGDVITTAVYPDVSVTSSYDSYMRRFYIHIATRFISAEPGLANPADLYGRDFKITEDNIVTLDARHYTFSISSEGVANDFM